MTTIDAPPGGFRRFLVEPARPTAIKSRPDAHWLVVGTVCLGAFMGQLDASIVTLALPAMRRHLNASVSSVEWVALSYLLTLVVLVPAIGRLADAVGRKLLYTYGFLLFSVASVACGLAPNLPALEALRILQAIGAAMLQANSVALIRAAMPPSQLGRGIGIQGAAQAVGLAAGPTVGGLLLAVGGWRLIFLVNAPVGAAGAVAGWFLLPRTHHKTAKTRFDWLGLGLFAPATAGLLVALSQLTHQAPNTYMVAALLLVAAVAAAAFVTRERRAAAPMIDSKLFRSPNFTVGLLSGLLSYAVLFGVLFVSPFFLETCLGETSGRAGLMLTFLPAALAAVAPAAGKASDRFGARRPAAAGLALAAGFLTSTALFAHSLSALLVGLTGVGLGIGLFTPANNASIMAAAPPEKAGAASGVLNMTRGLGTSLGIALSAIVFTAEDAGATGTPRVVASGFRLALLMLATMAAVAAIVAAAPAERLKRLRRVAGKA